MGEGWEATTGQVPGDGVLITRLLVEGMGRRGKFRKFMTSIPSNMQSLSIQSN